MVEVYQAAGEERGLQFTVEEHGPATADVDPDLTRRALANLLDNAVEHLPAGCRVVVSAESRGASVHLTVTDNGPGFPAELREQAFERWAKGTSSSGFGIGLALVRSVARAHGGDAELLEPSGGGAAIRLTFPRRVPAAAA
jgi:signal transduction histidine kinase